MSRESSINDVAVIGISCRFPGAENLAQFWENLRDGVESISTFSDGELTASGIERSVFSQSNYVKAGSVLENIGHFDASFFGINPREAESMDPQQRLFLECAWHTLEDAGYNPDTYAGTVGVYGGCAASSYLRELERNLALLEMVGHIQVLIGNDKDYLTTHTSFKLNLKGPSFSVQTACSTSLLAIALAWEALVAKRCDMALAGGVCVRVPHRAGYFFEPGGIFSPDGHCRVFDAKAQGVVFGNGVGIVLLKRLADALADRDCIYAVIKGAAINNDGAGKASYTAPGLDGQADVIAMAQTIAGVHPETIAYVETHGTGTSVGDPVEVGALTKAFRRRTAKNSFCAIGSVKSNIGHLDPAAGVASFVKTVLSIENKLIPPSLYFETPNPNIDFANSPFYVNTRLSPWPSGNLPRRAGVSAFGIGGTNVHVILEEAPPQVEYPPVRTHHLLVLSARTPSALETATANLSQYLQEHPGISASDVAYTSQFGRRAFPCRRAIVYHHIDDAINQMLTLDPERVITGDHHPKERPAVFLFAGQGSQYVNMSADLYRVEPAYRTHVDRCAELLAPLLGVDLRQRIFVSSGEDESGSELTQTKFAQPALFLIGYSLAKLWQEWGIEPQAMIGHSIGEYVAACLAGVFSFEDALMLVAARGRMMQALPGGSMVAVAASETEVLPLLDAELSIAAVNEESLCSVSGPTEAIERFELCLERKGTAFRRLHTSHAFHSQMMDPILEDFARMVRQVRLNSPRIPYVSGVTGTWISASEATNPEYWSRHLREPVRFADGLTCLMSVPGAAFIEVGPGNTLSSFALRHAGRSNDKIVVSSLRHPLARQGDVEFILTSLARLWVSGASVDWHGFHAHERPRRVHLPPYPFERQRYWADAPGAGAGTPVKNPDVGSWFYTPTWEYTFTPETSRDDATAQKLCWVVFADACGWGARIAAKLERSGHDVITVTTAQRFSKNGANHYHINPRRREDYASLFASLRESYRRPRKIVHLLTVTGASSEQTEIELFDRYQDLGLYSLAYVAQSLIAAKLTDPLDIVVISSAMHAVSGDEQLSPGKSTILAACKSIPQEYPNFSCRAIDIVLPLAGAVDPALVDMLVADLQSSAPQPAVLAYRGGQRWKQTFERLYLEPPDDSLPLLRDSGVYLITGGLGNVGLTVAEELARTVQANLVLLGRSAFPRRQQWQRWMRTHDRDDPTSHKIRRLHDIESFGSRVLPMSADLADELQMRRVVKRIYASFGQLNGVIHAAGNVSPEGFFGIDQATPERCERQFRGKVRGLITLSKILNKRDLDFWLLVSSISSVLAGLGYIGYSAANVFLDTLARRQSLAGDVPWISINWDTWNFDKPARKHQDAKPTELAMTPVEGLDALFRILSWATSPQIVVSTGDLHVRLDQWINGSATRANQTQGIHAPGTHTRSDLLSHYVAPRNPLERALANIWQEMLGLVAVGVLDNFFTDLSGTSLMATQLVARIRSEFETEMPLRGFFEMPTIAQLAVAIEAGLKPTRAPVEAEREASARPQVLKSTWAER
jgi:acyl transferase domain-containing protein/acyl carrier protein